MRERIRVAVLPLFCVIAFSAMAAGPEAVPATVAIDRLMRQFHDADEFNGAVLVGGADGVIYASAFGVANREWDIPNSLDTKFEIASMTKPMTAMLVMQLVEAGKVRLDAHVSDYLPDYDPVSGKKITIEQLLNHTSGIPQDIAFPAPGESPEVAARVNADQFSLQELVKLIGARPLRFEPGTQFGYSSDAYAVLGAVVEKVTGRAYRDVLRDRILVPAGMTYTEAALLQPLVRKRAAGYRRTYFAIENAMHIGATPAGGLYSTVFDLYRWDRALYDETLVREATKRLLFAPRDVVTAYGWKTAQEEHAGRKRLVLRTTGGLPGFVNLLLRVPEERRVIILLSNVRGPAHRLDAIASAINSILDGAPQVAPTRSMAMALARVLREGRPDDVAGEFQRLRGHADVATSEAELNSLGYELLSLRDYPGALAIFRLNVEAFPKSPNVYDSLGEAYMISGDRKRAIENFEKVLALDPKNGNAPIMLEKLRQQQ